MRPIHAVVVLTDSKLGTPKINPESVASFSHPKKRPPPHHDYHAIHHNFTTKTPRSGTRFCQKPLQKHQKQPRKTPPQIPADLPIRRSLPPGYIAQLGESENMALYSLGLALGSLRSTPN